MDRAVFGALDAKGTKQSRAHEQQSPVGRDVSNAIVRTREERNIEHQALVSMETAS